MRKFGLLAVAGVLGLGLGIASCSQKEKAGGEAPAAQTEEHADHEHESGEMIVDASFRIKGMTCADCQSRVQTAIQGIDGVESADVNLDEGMAEVHCAEGKVTRAQVIDAVKGAGFEAEDI